MNDVIFNELDFTSGDEYEAFQNSDVEEVYNETTSEVIGSPVGELVSADPFFMGMKLGGVAIIISLGTAVIITIFKRLGNV